MVVLVVTWDGIALLVGVLALIYSLYIRDLIFQRKVHRDIDLRGRSTHPAQRFVESAQSLAWVILIAHWCFAALAPTSGLHGARLFAPSFFISLPAVLLLLLFFFLMNHARSALESLASWRLGALETERTELVTDSIYFFCRHPFALFSLLEAASLWLLAPYSLSLVVLALLALVTHLENLFEEEVLLRQHPAQYARYMKHVHRYWPGALERS
jgi:protein-S-isoprenylcysteine O-methyltransferase Ste14